MQTKTSKTVNRIRIVMESCFRRCHVRIINASAAGLLRKKHNRASLCVTLNHRETVDEKTPNQPRPLINMLRLNWLEWPLQTRLLLRDAPRSWEKFCRPVVAVITDRQGCSVIAIEAKFRVNVGALRGRLNVVRKLLSRRLSLHTRCPLRL